MKALFNKNILQSGLLFFIISIFGLFYWVTVMSLPLFGDATIHGIYANNLLKGGWRFVNADYPPFYYYLMTQLYTFFGEKGYNLVPYVGFLFLLLSTFLFIRQVTKNYYLALFSIILIGCSPKIIFYSARMYQEILITALFVFCYYLFFKFLETKRRTDLILLSFFVSITLSIKQQGLFILLPSIIIFFMIYSLKRMLQKSDVIIFLFISLVIGTSFYFVLFHNKGIIQPGSEEFAPLRLVNVIGKKIFLYQDRPEFINNLNERVIGDPETIQLDNSNIRDSEKMNARLENIELEQQTQGHLRAESSHIHAFDVFTNFDKFNKANSLYLDWYGQILKNNVVMLFYFFGILAGILYCIINYKKYSNLLIFTGIFLIINYVLFARNTDQSRYHLFLPVFLMSYVMIFTQYIVGKIRVRHIYLKLTSSIILVVSLFMPILLPSINLNRSWGNSQIYASSIGGIPSIQEAGQWLKKRNDVEFIGQQCGNETSYYSQNRVLGDWRIYFLDVNQLRDYFRLYNVSYYIIFSSQIVDDNRWNHICWVPRSFYKRIENNFKKVFTSTKNDIYIYDTHQ